jgi:hypothetical protein
VRCEAAQPEAINQTANLYGGDGDGDSGGSAAGATKELSNRHHLDLLLGKIGFHVLS